MHSSSLLAVLALSSVAAAGPCKIRDLPTDPFLRLDAFMKSARARSLDEIKNAAPDAACRPDNVRVRKEWGKLTKPERLAYIDAVQCLQSKPSQTPSDIAPGAKTRFDDFVVAHINQTLSIHYTGNFLSWHRFFLHTYETTLKEECGYTGAHPYWDWTSTVVNGMENNAIWDGSETSMGSNGAALADKGPRVLEVPGFGTLPVPDGTGGGCVTSGPFANMTVNLGPVSLPAPGPVTLGNGPEDPNIFAHNPRCLKRDLSTELLASEANIDSVLALLNTTTIVDFQNTLEGIPATSLGVHGAGHLSMGGDPGMDVFVSPGDPVFYLHHGGIDRVWWIWQQLGGEERITGDQRIGGTRTFFNLPPSDPTSDEDLLNFGFAAAAGHERPIKELLSTTAGPLCYVYE